MHPIANVGLSSAFAEALTTLAMYGMTFITSTPVPDNVQKAATTLIAIVLGTFIHQTTDPTAIPLKTLWRKKDV